MKFATLPNGAKMPLLGFGTQLLGDALPTALDAALAAGYRHIDTATMYENEEEIGKVLRSWLSQGKVKREELFIVTKLPMVGMRADLVEKWIKTSLEKLQLDYVDLYLVHKPFGFSDTTGNIWGKDKDGNFVFDHKTDHLAIWKAMEAQVDAGRTRAIGLSDFTEKQIQRILDNCRIRPANMQIELNVRYQQRKIVDYCQRQGITVCAYASLGSPGKEEHYKEIGLEVTLVNILELPAVKELAKKYNKTPAQILLKHVVSKGIATIPKSANPTRIKQNISAWFILSRLVGRNPKTVLRDEVIAMLYVPLPPSLKAHHNVFSIFDFELSEEDFKKLDAVDQGNKGKRYELSQLMKGLDKHPENPANN